MFGTLNSAEAYNGYDAGLHAKSLMGKKAAEEKSLKAYVNADAKRQQEFDDPRAEINKTVELQKQIYKPVFYLQGGADNDANTTRHRGWEGSGARWQWARACWFEVTEEKQKPNGERLRGYQDSGLPSLEQRLFSTAPVYKSLQIAQLTQSLTEMQQVLGADNEVVKAALAGKSPAERATIRMRERCASVTTTKSIIIFDGNIESLPWNFVYDDIVGRSISTDSRAIFEALRKIYNADALADELTGTATAGESKAIKPPTEQR